MLMHTREGTTIVTQQEKVTLGSDARNSKQVNLVTL